MNQLPAPHHRKANQTATKGISWWLGLPWLGTEIFIKSQAQVQKEGREEEKKKKESEWKILPSHPLACIGIKGNMKSSEDVDQSTHPYMHRLWGQAGVERSVTLWKFCNSVLGFLRFGTADSLLTQETQVRPPGQGDSLFHSFQNVTSYLTTQKFHS